ncbi:MAG: ABC transporter substrate-binding protein [Actinomycetota bacterium]|nr:ABC transporter substrate-binding protein [Actinomycetota bacterium]
MKRNKVFGLAAAIAASTLLVSTLPASAASPDIRIGSIQPISGSGFAAYGVGLTSAAAFGVTLVQEAMTAAGVGGSCKMIAQEDSGADAPSIVTEAATKLIKSDKVNFIIGSLTSGASLAIGAITASASGVIVIASAASSPALTTFKDRDTLFRTYPSDLLQAVALVNAVSKAYGRTAWVTVGAINNSFGAGLAKAFKRAWIKNGGHIRGTVYWNAGAASYDSEAAALVKGKKRDAFVLIDYPDSFAKLAPALTRTKKWDPATTFMTEAFNSASAIKTVGAEFMNGIRGTSAKTNGTDPAAWKTAFTKAYPKNNPGTFVDGSGFDAAVLACLAGISAGSMTSRALAKGLRNVGGVNGGTAYSWNQLTAAVKDVAAGKPVTYNGVWGYTKFDKAGDPSGGAFEVWSINDGVISKDPTQDIKF